MTDPVVIDGTTQPGFQGAPIVELHGELLPLGSRGLRLVAGDSVVRGLVINRFSFEIAIGEPQAGDGNRIVGNYLGTDVTGTQPAGYVMGIGIHVIGGANHFIGGPLAEDRNVISGNGLSAITLDGGGRVTIKGNYLGTNATGDAALASAGGVGFGIYSVSEGPAVVGGLAQGEGNVISGHRGVGITVHGGSGHEIIGNVIGIDLTGEKALPNGNGVETDSVRNTRIVGNVISGNSDFGIHLGGDLGTIVQGNKIGVDVDGLQAIPNGFHGLALTSTTDVLIGGTTSAARNIISGNGGNGIHFFNFPSQTTIQGNFIGVGVDRRPLGNTGAGIACCALSAFPAGRNVIGGLSDEAGNVIAHNVGDGIVVGNPFTTGAMASILHNSIYANGLLGINLSGADGPTPNDPDDPDTGPNDLQNFPVVDGITSGGGQTKVTASLNSTPNTDFRLEFFRNEACNGIVPGGFAWFYGEGQTFVGTQQVTTDSDGNWSDTVTLAGETAPSELITATATRFSDAGVSLVGSTSEFSECLADLSVTKSDEPDPVTAGGQLKYTIEVANVGPAPATEAAVTDTLPAGVTVISITPSQGTCSQLGSKVTCALGRVDRSGVARITILIDPGSTPRSITNATAVSSELRDPDSSDNDASATTQIMSGATIVVRKETQPTGDPAEFEFTGDTPGKIRDGQTIEVVVPAPGTYAGKEVVPSGWDLRAITCDDADSTGSTEAAAATFHVVTGERVTCTFTNRKRGRARLIKTVGAARPSGSQSFRFELRQGASATAAGTVLDVASASASNGGTVDFTTPLVPTTSYALCETVMPGWMTTLGPPLYVVFNPSGDNSTVCSDFNVAPGETKSFAIDNQLPPGGLARTIGFWKNWASCASSKGSQKPMLDQTLASGDPAGISVGTLSLHAGDCLKAVRLLDKSTVDTDKKMASDAAFGLAAQLLASRLNIVAGAGSCPAAVSAINAGQALLAAVRFNGNTHDRMIAAQSSQASALATTLDGYNNNRLC